MRLSRSLRSHHRHSRSGSYEQRGGAPPQHADLPGVLGPLDHLRAQIVRPRFKSAKFLHLLLGLCLLSLA